MQYKWKSGSQIKISAQDAGERLEQISSGIGRPMSGLKSKEVLEDARNPKSPLHKAFEWNDGKAAEKFRESQASYLLRNIITIYVDVSRNDGPRDIRAYVNFHDAGSSKDRTFYPMMQVLNDDEKRQQLLADAHEEYFVYRGRYQFLKELTGIFEAGDLVFGRVPRKKKGGKRREAFESR